MYNLWSFLQQTVAASLAALFLLALKRAFLDKLSPRWQYWVWGVLVLRLVVPVGFFNRRALLDGGWAVDVVRVSWEQRLHSALSSPWTLSRPVSPHPPAPRRPAPVGYRLAVYPISGRSRRHRPVAAGGLAAAEGAGTGGRSGGRPQAGAAAGHGRTASTAHARPRGGKPPAPGAFFNGGAAPHPGAAHGLAE